MRETWAFWMLVGAIVALAACGHDAAVDPCPGGELVDVEGDAYCVAEAVVIEKGFLCPETLPHQFAYEDLVVCAGDDEVSEAQLADVYTEYRAANPSPNNGANNGAGNNGQPNNGGANNGCVDVDADGFCVPDDCDDTNAQVGPAIPEVPRNGLDDDCDGLVDEDSAEPECRVDNDCGDGNQCFDGECAIPCAVDSDCSVEQVCRGGHCQEGAVACRSDADCDADEVCADGLCQQ